MTALKLNLFQKKLKNKNIITNILRIQAYDSVMYGFFSIGFIHFMLKGKSLLDYTKLFSPNDYEKIILKYFQYLKIWKKYIVLFAVSIENLKNLK